MLLTLSAGSLRRLISKNGAGALDVFDVPEFAIKQLELRGLNIPASMLAGWTAEDLDRLRDRADKAGCPCLVLIEDKSLDLGSPRDTVRTAAKDRMHRLAIAANRLGCNALAIRCDAADKGDAFDLIADEIKSLMPRIERLELNVLIAPGKGVTSTPDRLTELIKQIGGFRIGSLPDFAHAASCGDAIEALRKLAPYAGAVQATVESFSKAGEHKGYDLAACINAIRSVGFVNTVAIDYVGSADPLKNIEQARQILAAAIEDDGSKSSDK